MSRHTPGPWSLEHIDGETYRVIDAMDMQELSRIATVHFHDDAVGETKANACLIAAAPELLEALRIARDHIDMAALEISHCKYAERIRAAIAKATGEKQ